MDFDDYIDSLASPPKEIDPVGSLPEPLNYKSGYPQALKLLRDIVGHTRGRFDIELALEHLGISVITEDLTGDSAISGYIESLSPGKWRIAVNRYENRGRQRFTLAHELAHLLFHREMVVEQTSDSRRFGEAIRLFRSRDYTRWEMEANAFAAALLMPSQEFRTVWDATASVEAVSDHFDVSLYAAEFRAKKLGLDPKKKEK